MFLIPVYFGMKPKNKKSEYESELSVPDTKKDGIMKIEMTGYNDGKAFALYYAVKLIPFFTGSFILSVMIMIPALIFKVYCLLFLFILPGVLFLFIIGVWIVNSYCISLPGKGNFSHEFCFKNGTLFKDGKTVRDRRRIKIHKFKKFLFLELENSFYRVGNKDFSCGNRKEFLAQLKFLKGGYVCFNLEDKAKDKIIEMLFEHLRSIESEKVFCSDDKTRIKYIYRNNNGTYSLVSERLIIADEMERLITRRYGWWVPDSTDAMLSLYGTAEEALKDNKTELAGFKEITPHR